MKEKQQIRFKTDEPKLSLTLVPEDVLNSIIDRQERILDLLSDRKPPGINGFLTEREAMALVRKKAT